MKNRNRMMAFILAVIIALSLPSAAFADSTPVNLTKIAKKMMIARSETDGFVPTFSFYSLPDEDIYGNVYDGFFSFTGRLSGVTPFMELSLNRKYALLTAKCYVGGDTKDGDKAELLIYADGVLIYRSGPRDRRADATDIYLDVTNVKVLKVEAHGLDEKRATIYLAEPFLS